MENHGTWPLDMSVDHSLFGVFMGSCRDRCQMDLTFLVFNDDWLVVTGTMKFYDFPQYTGYNGVYNGIKWVIIINHGTWLL